jgi:membrane protein CcdC involved in cytochrome C biogenesis
MIKLLLTFIVLTIFVNCMAQRAEIKNDTVYYKERKFYPGQVVPLKYGSSATKDFAYVSAGSTLCTSQVSKFEVKIDKVLMKGPKVYIRGKLINAGPQLVKIFIDVEGAIDNNEI